MLPPSAAAMNSRSLLDSRHPLFDKKSSPRGPPEALCQLMEVAQILVWDFCLKNCFNSKLYTENGTFGLDVC